jgi:putative DNA primase/helicase
METTPPDYDPEEPQPYSDEPPVDDCNEPCSVLEPSEPVRDTPKTPSDTCTDTGNAQRLANLHGENLRHCYPWRSWLHWQGTHWQTDETGTIMRLGKQTMRGLAEWATKLLATLPDDDERRPALKATAKWATKSLDAPRLKAMIDLARCEVPILPGEMDRDGMLLNVRNGTLNLKTGELYEHHRDDLITRVCPVKYDAAATCPTWEHCLNTWQAGNGDMIAFLQRAVGYSLTGSVKEHCLFFLHGDGANGKSTFLDVLLTMLGEYGMQAIPELLVERKGEVHLTERADLHKRRLVATIETEDGRKLAEALVKSLTGGDRIRARKCHRDSFEFDAEFKVWLAANHKPQVRGTDVGIWRRIKVVPFTVTIAPEHRDKDLQRKLRGELPGILAWAVRGCVEWQRMGVAEPEEVTAATDAYRAEQDVVRTWIEECCTTGPDYRCRQSILLASLLAWSKNGGEASLSQRQFGKRLETMGYASYTNNGTWRLGIALRQNDTEATEPNGS